MQAGAAKVFLGGPPLVKMAIDEDADEEELGGAEMHARTSGLADYLAADEPDALRLGREIVGHLNWRKAGPGRPRARRSSPCYDPEELLGIASADIRHPFDVREVIARVVDGRGSRSSSRSTAPRSCAGGRTSPASPSASWPTTGSCSREESQKGAQFIQLCNRIDTPILFLQNITGFMVGTRYEQGGIIKDGAKLINAVSNSTVPHLTLMVGASLRRGQLRHVRARLRPAVRLHLAEPPHRRDGTQAARRRADHRRAAEGRGRRAGVRRGRVRRPARRVRGAGRVRSRRRCSPPAGSGTTASSTRATRARCSAWRCRQPTPHRCEGTSDFGVWRM